MKTLILSLLLVGCASVTPQDRASIYRIRAIDFTFQCKAYKFDRSMNLVADVPEMTEACR